MNTGSIETTLVSRLTQDIEDLRQDKQYLRDDLTRLQRELQRERLEKERYRRRVGELEDLLERVQKDNSAAVRVNASQGSVKLEQFANRSAGILRKSPSLEIIWFKEPPSPPHSLIDVDVNEATEESKPTVNEGEVDYENQHPNFAYLADENCQLSAVNVINEGSLDAADTSDSTLLQAKDHMETGSVEDVDDNCGPDAPPPPPSDKALGKRKVSDDPPTFSSSFKRAKVSHQPSKSGPGPLLPLKPPCTPAPQSDALEKLSPSSPPDSSSGSFYRQQDGPPSSLDAESCSSSITTPIPPLPFRPRVTAGVGPSSLSISAAPTPSSSVSSATAPVPPLPFRPRLVRNFKIKEEEAVTLPVDIVANYLQDVPTFSINPDPSGVPFVSRKFLAKVYGGSDRQFLQYIEVPQLLSNSSSHSSTSTSSSSSPSNHHSTPAMTISPTRRRRKRLMFPTPEVNPSMPLFPGDAGLIFTSRTEILKDGPWSVFRKYDRGIDVEVKREGEPCSSEMGGKGDGKSNKKAKGKQKSVVWVYVGDYECTKVGKISREEWGAQNREVKKRWANRVANKMTGCYLSMRARIGLRRAGIVPGLSPVSTPSPNPPTNETPPTDDVGLNESTNNVPESSSAPAPSSSIPPSENSDKDQLDEDPDSRYERLLREEISAHRSRKPKHPITERDILEAFEKGEEGVDIVQLKCVAYDWEWARDFEGRWERGERVKWWETDGTGEREGVEMGDEREGRSANSKTKKSQGGGRTQGTSAGTARRRSSRTITNTRGKGQEQAEQDVRSTGSLSHNEPIDDHRAVATAQAVLPFSQIPPQPVASLEPLTSTSSISMSTTPISPLNPASRDTLMNPGPTDSNSGLDDGDGGGGGGGGAGDIDDGYLSYASEEEMEMGNRNLDDLSDSTNWKNRDVA